MHMELTSISTTSKPGASSDPNQALALNKSIEFIEQRQRRLQRVHQVDTTVSVQKERYAQDRAALLGPASHYHSDHSSVQLSSEPPGRVLQSVNLHVAAHSPCRPGCTCACHTQNRTQTQSIVDRIFGQLFIGFAGIPVLSAKCDNALCRKAQQPQIQAEYWFPAGVFWSQIIRFQAAYQTNMGPSWQLRTLRRIPDSAEAVTFAMTGNIDGLKSLFAKGFASPVDVSDTRGYSLLRVCRLFVTLLFWITCSCVLNNDSTTNASASGQCTAINTQLASS